MWKKFMIQSQNEDMLRLRIDDLLSLQIINKRYNLRLYSFDFEIGGVIVCRIGSRWKYRFENELEIKIGQIYQMVCLECFNNKLLSINSKLTRKHYRDIWKKKNEHKFPINDMMNLTADNAGVRLNWFQSEKIKVGISSF